MKITFIHHSSFCVELEDKVFIFDYFNGNKIPEFSFQGKLPELDPEKIIYVFASHQHRDHFDMEIFSWREKYPDIRYIFPKEMRFSDNYLKKHGVDLSVKEQIYYMKPNTSLNLEDIHIETLLSTDTGVAFLVTCAEKTIYHAGDLHWWHWEGEEQVFLQYQERIYKAQIDKLKDRNVDVAFVVLDSRLSHGIFWGIDYFLNHVNASYVIPMHLWQKYSLIEQYKKMPQTQAFRERIIDIYEENQVLEI